MQLKFCGAAGHVTGSAHLITLEDGFTVLLDCGLYQGSGEDMANFNLKWMFNPADINCLVLSHAHIDHCGKIPKLVKDGFRGIIYSTPATRDITSIMLMDSAKIQHSDAEFYNKRKRKANKDFKELRQPLYDSEDVRMTMSLFVSMPYHHDFKVHPDVLVKFRDAGHILGSANVHLTVSESGQITRLGFTGDIGRPLRPILNDPEPMDACDYLIAESTYGDRVHKAAPAETQDLIRVIKETCVERRGKVIIPAFSLGRTQEILYILDQLYNEGKLPKVPVYMDSPLAINATEIFRIHPECFDKELSEYMLVDENPFGFNTLSYMRSVEMSKSLNLDDEPCIIISASGMANAGRIRHHIYNNIENPKNTILFVGYCSPGTLGGILKSGVPEVKLYGEIKQVRAKIEILESFSAHGDKNEMLDFMKNQIPNLKTMFLVHGEPIPQKSYKEFLLNAGFKNIQIPSLGESVTL